MTEDLETTDNQQQPEQSAPEPEQIAPNEEKSTISNLRETLTEEEASKDQAPQKTGFLQKVTRILRPGRLKKEPQTSTSQQSSGDVSVPSTDSTSEQTETPTPEDNLSTKPLFSEDTIQEPGASEDQPEPGDLEEVLSEPSEDSIFDLLNQVRESGLGDTDSSVSESEAPTSENIPAHTSEEAESTEQAQEPDTVDEDSKDLTDQIMTTTSLASRLWGLQEESTDLKEEPAPSSDEEAPDEAVSPETGQEGKRGFFDRFKRLRGEDKTTRPLKLDDESVIDRISRTTGTLHEPPEKTRPAQPSQSDFSEKGQGEVKEGREEINGEEGRFVFYPVEPEDEISIPGRPAEKEDSVAPSVTGKEDDRSQLEETQEQEAEPITSSSNGEHFDVDAFLSTSSPPASDEETQAADETDFGQLDSTTWGGAYPRFDEEDIGPEEGTLKSGDSLEKIRAIALESYQDGEGVADGSSGDMVISTHRKSWWKSLPLFERIVIAVVAGLIVVVAGIAAFSANKFWQQPAPLVVSQPTITPSTLPSPIEVVLPGAWTFKLTSSAVATTPDKPGTGLWLMGSEVRRIIELPWNKQTEAVIQTFTPGDLIQVKFDDGSVLNYKVDQVTRVDATDTSILTDNKPSLLIILAGEKDSQRWVVIARP